MLEKFGLSGAALWHAALWDESVLGSPKVSPSELGPMLRMGATPEQRMLAMKVLRKAIWFSEYSTVVAQHYSALCRCVLTSANSWEVELAAKLLADFGRVERHRGIVLRSSQVLRD
eukprot:RCo005649